MQLLGVPAPLAAVAPPAAEAEAEESFGLGSAARDRLRGGLWLFLTGGGGCDIVALRRGGALPWRRFSHLRSPSGGPGGGFQDIKFESLWRFAPCKLRYPLLREAG